MIRTRAQTLEKRLLELRAQQAEVQRLRALARAQKEKLESSEEVMAGQSRGQDETVSSPRRNSNEDAISGGEGKDGAESQIEELELGRSWLLDQGKMLLSEIQDLEAAIITRQL